MTDFDAHRLDKARVRRAFERAAGSYDAAAVLQREVGERMLERLELVRLAPERVLDIGAGTGHATRALQKRYRKARVVALDLALAMLRRHRSGRLRWPGSLSWRVCGDAEALPFCAACTELVFSNLTLQWCNAPDRALAEFRRVLRPGGLALFTTFGPDTLKELRASWAAADERVGDRTHVNAFIDMHDIGDALLRAGFADPVMDVEWLRLTYADVTALARDLKSLGATNNTRARPAGLTGKARIARLRAAYERYRDANGRLPATFEVIHGHAWVPAQDSTSAGSVAGEVRIPLERIGRRRG